MVNGHVRGSSVVTLTEYYNPQYQDLKTTIKNSSHASRHTVEYVDLILSVNQIILLVSPFFYILTCQYFLFVLSRGQFSMAWPS